MVVSNQKAGKKSGPLMFLNMLSSLMGSMKRLTWNLAVTASGIPEVVSSTKYVE